MSEPPPFPPDGFEPPPPPSEPGADWGLPDGGGWVPAPDQQTWESAAPPRRARRRHGIVLTAMSAVVALAVVGAVAGQVVGAQLPPRLDVGAPVIVPSASATPTSERPEPTPDPALTSPSELPSSPPGSGPAGPWQLPERVWDVLPTPATLDDLWTTLQAVELLDELPPVLVDCPPVQTVSTEVEYRELVRQQWHCVHAAWTPVLERKRWSTVEPSIHFFTGTGSESDCGYLEAPAFYCSADSGKVYFGDGHMEMAMDWDLSLNEMVNHEYAHHVQSLAGITTAKLQLTQTDEIERRAELQATCWSATMTRNSETVGFDQDHWDSWQQRLETMTIDGIHGSRESILYWGTRGLYAETLGDCNTWSVDDEAVS